MNISDERHLHRMNTSEERHLHRMNAPEEWHLHKMNDDEMSCAQEDAKNKNDNKILYMHQILESQFYKQIKEEQTMYERNADLIKYKDYISPPKKRAFTLGAIDGIGGISILNAPLMNPENAKIDPPILQLPSATNLIKNVHVKVHFDKNIDKSYKYRTQNSNRDIIRNMKPMYSLPEKVMTYYMHKGGHGRAEQKGGLLREGAVADVKEDVKGDLVEDVMEDVVEDVKEDLVKDVKQETRPDDPQMNKFGDDLPNSNADTERGTPCEDTQMACDSNDTSDRSFREEEYQVRSCHVSSPPAADKDAMWPRGTQTMPAKEVLKAALKVHSKTKLVKKNEELKKLASVANISAENKTPSDETNGTQGDKNFENEDQLNFFKLNQIMSSTLTNALKMLADDVFV
ncbi:hypothetical protein C922_00988 [Plasmodium inui San Antonio 1]|uniref:Uncharacterized protein n=1 Tax=Plasmodium inui San Antonio 1 TaxID=1237626 RepID=W7AHV1_9APIC|nr:hypothetical protein C922_00988 [Plasmodium inui San Antonio 1]EUD68589.1 hypothetical protein C922_00988 [Plasmodium inui San Antonio 1]